MNLSRAWHGFTAVGCIALACSSSGGGETRTGSPSGSGGSGGDGTGSGSGGTLVTTTGAGGTIGVGGAGGSGPGQENNPTTCSAAAANRTYIGCDFWPTVTYNPVYKEFSFAVVVANGGGREAKITVARTGFSVTETVPAGGLKTVNLPWVMDLKGEEFTRTDATTGARKKTSILVKGGAYHLTSDIPVTVWQFNPLDYQQPVGNCPGLPGTAKVCLSVSNDASLLLPSTAMTGNYRLFGRSARLEGGGELYTSSQGGFAFTATQDNTTVRIQLTPARKAEVGTGATIGSATVAAGPGVMAAAPGATISYPLQAGDVLQLVGEWGKFEPEPHGDLSGSVVVADKPIQVIAFNALLSGVPGPTNGNPDHVEETVLPAEVIGKSYVVAPPTGPDHGVPGHMVRFFGNVAGTTLEYPAGTPSGGSVRAPTTLGEGDVIEIGPIKTPFVVTANQPFTVASIMLGGTIQDPKGTTRGDPSITMEVTPEQFRKQYMFLAPTSYLENYADILLPKGATATLDGNPLASAPQAIGNSDWTVVREKLENGANDGAHKLEATAPVGLQVMGFGAATGYCYPGGLDLKLISIPPIIK